MKTSTSFAAVAATALAVAFAGPVVAKGAGPLNFEKVDTNQDGFIDKTEAAVAQAERFAKADADGNGILSQDEMKAHRMAKRAERRDKMGAKAFEKLDTNKDGSLSKEEFDAGMAARGERHKKRHGKRAEKRFGKMMKRLDTNKDGGLSQEELNTGFVNRMFDRLDEDKDGRISVAEAEAAKSKMRKRFGHN